MAKNKTNSSNAASSKRRLQLDGSKPKPNNRVKDRVDHNPGRPGGYLDAVAASLNDASWYAANPELLMDAASVSYNAAVGHPLHWMRGAITPGEDVPGNYVTIPGIMAFKVSIIPGWSEDNKSPINIAAKNLYAYVRYVNSGHANYDPADLMMYTLALDSAYSMVAWMRRVYGELMLTSQYNRYLPEAQIASEGLDYGDFMHHIVDLRAFINHFQLKLGSFVIPKDIAFFTRHMWMFSNVYLDEPNQKAQMYKFVPNGFWRYIETDGPGHLSFEDLTGVSTFDDLVEYANKILNAIASSEDCGIISGDILKAFGDDRIFKMDALLPEYVVVPVPNEEVLDQIQNMTICGNLVPDPSGTYRAPTIYQDATVNPTTGGAIIFRPTTVVTTGLTPGVWGVDRMISVDTPVPSPATTMVATRLTAMGRYEDALLSLTCVGTEVVNTCLIYTLDEQMHVHGNYVPTQFSAITPSASEMRSFFNFFALIEMFDRHPGFYLFIGSDLAFVSFDVSNYTFIDERVLGRMHETAVLSLLNVPVMGTYASKLR